MDFLTLLKGVKSYEKLQYNESYKELVLERRKTLENIDRISEIIKFLNSWGVIRFPYKEAPKLKRALRKLSKHFHALRNSNLIDFDFNREINVGGQKKKTSEIIKEIYEQLCKVRGIGPAAASKTMHCIIPSLFMMWDEKIREGYGYAGNAIGYLKFLRESQRILKDMIGKCGKSAEELSREASPEMNRPLTKLLDEYNYMKFTKGEDLPNPTEDC